MLDLFCGRLGVAKVFAARGWKCVVVDLVEPPEIPPGCTFIQANVLNIRVGSLFGKPLITYVRDAKLSELFAEDFDFIWASSPCEEFSVHGMKCFHPNPKYPENGIRLFNHTREICEASGVTYVMENVRAAQQFVGKAVHHCGPYYLWGSGVPPLMHQGITKPFRAASGSYMDKCPPGYDRKKWRMLWQKDFENRAGSRKDCPGVAATIPPELANCVADYAERLLEMKVGGSWPATKAG
jgi:hypothetical protein